MQFAIEGEGERERKIETLDNRIDLDTMDLNSSNTARAVIIYDDGNRVHRVFIPIPNKKYG